MEPIFFEVEVDGESKRVCLVDLPTHRTVEQLADLLVSRYGTRAEQTDLVILRPNVDTPIVGPVKQPDSLESLVRRAPRAEIRILYSVEFQHRLSADLANRPKTAYTSEGVAKLLEDVREHELTHYARSSDALLSARSGFVYRAPSGHYVRQFLRVGNIQRSRSALDAIFFWILPFVADCRAIVVDTWSISAIALNAARLLGRYRADDDCRVDFFPAYFDGGNESRYDAARILQYPRMRDGSILVLFSAVRSGRSFERLRKVFDSIVPGEDINYLAIYSLAENVGIEALCRGLRGFESAVREGSVITIDPGSFFPLTARDRPLMIRKVDAEPNRAFFREYKGSRAVRIHRDVFDAFGTKLRHHAIDVDVESLLSKRPFREKLEAKLAGIPRPSIVVVPPHNAGEAMSAVASKLFVARYGAAPQIVTLADSAGENEPLKEIFRKTHRGTEVLVLDDVSTTGERLNRFQVNLRTVGFGGHISYVVGVARPDDEEAWKERIGNLRLRDGPPNDVECVEKVVLPDWDQGECPWCLEYRWLSEVLGSGGLDRRGWEMVRCRREVLEAAADREGLVDEVLWIPPEQQRPVISPGSIFLPHVGATEADVVASVAGTIQRMRTDPDGGRRLHADFPQPRMLSPKNFLGPSPRYNDPILGLAIMRSAHPSELRRWEDGDEAGRSKQLCDALVGRQESHALEVVVALAQRKFSLIGDDVGVFEAVQSEGARQLLRTVLHQQ